MDEYIAEHGGFDADALAEARSRSAGVACARAGTTDVIDAAVVVGAAVRGDIVVTGDDDLHRLATALDLPLDIEPI